jgi:hypothetical protein
LGERGRNPKEMYHSFKVTYLHSLPPLGRKGTRFKTPADLIDKTIKLL